MPRLGADWPFALVCTRAVMLAIRCYFLNIYLSVIKYSKTFSIWLNQAILNNPRIPTCIFEKFTITYSIELWLHTWSMFLYYLHAQLTTGWRTKLSKTCMSSDMRYSSRQTKPSRLGACLREQSRQWTTCRFSCSRMNKMLNTSTCKKYYAFKTMKHFIL